MAAISSTGVRLAGVAAAVPQGRRTVADEAALTGRPLEELTRLAESVGIVERRSSEVLCTSDLCTAAAARLLQDSGTDARDIDALLFVSQTPDYVMPATACVIQARLGLPKSCLAFDINLGCSGFVYGLSVVSSLMQSGQIRKALLLCGDTLRSHLPRNATHDHPVDVGNLLLFGDAGSAALLVHDAAAAPLHFLLGSDGQGAGNLLVRAGATRCPSTAATQTLSARDDGVFRSDEHILLNGPEIFSFTLREVAPLATGTLQAAGWTLEDTDAVVMHQANTFMLKHLGKRLKIPEHKLVIEMARWGNTSSASIPLAMVAALANRLRTQPMKLLLCGFGVGYSWAGLALQSTAMTVPDLIEVSDDFAHAV